MLLATVGYDVGLSIDLKVGGAIVLDVGAAVGLNV